MPSSPFTIADNFQLLEQFNVQVRNSKLTTWWKGGRRVAPIVQLAAKSGLTRHQQNQSNGNGRSNVVTGQLHDVIQYWLGLRRQFREQFKKDQFARQTHKTLAQVARRRWDSSSQRRCVLYLSTFCTFSLPFPKPSGLLRYGPIFVGYRPNQLRNVLVNEWEGNIWTAHAHKCYLCRQKKQHMCAVRIQVQSYLRIPANTCARLYC